MDDQDGLEYEEEQVEFLTKDTIKLGLTKLERIRGTRKFGFTKLDLNSQEIKTMDGPLEEFADLRYLNFEHNEIMDLAALSMLPNLVAINFKKNHLVRFDEFEELGQLQVAQLDDNLITDFSSVPFPALKVLTLSNNKIADFSGLTLMSSGIDGGSSLYPCLSVLDLSGNELTSLQGLSHLPSLTVLNVSKNLLVSLKGVEQNTNLVSLDASTNAIKPHTPEQAPLDPASAAHAHAHSFVHGEWRRLVVLPKLRRVSLLDNAGLYDQFEEELDVVNEVLSLLPALQAYDERPVTQQDRVAAAALKKQRAVEEASRRAQEEEERRQAQLEEEAEAAAARAEESDDDDEHVDIDDDDDDDY